MRTITAEISQAASPQAIALARALFIEYADWLKVDLCFQGFADELATLPGAYAPPMGRLLLAGNPDSAFGCIALRPLDHDAGDIGAPLALRAFPPSGSEPSFGRPGGGLKRGVTTDTLVPTVGEVKRLYVQPACRNGGWGHRLVEALIAQATAIGYRELKLDTLAWMTVARNVYASHGFCQCAPYYVNPLPGVVYMSRTL